LFWKIFYREGYSDVEIEIFFTEFEFPRDPDKPISAEEKASLVERLKKREFKFEHKEISANSLVVLEDEYKRYDSFIDQNEVK